jgi:amino acid transporter
MPKNPMASGRKLTLIPLVAATYFMVSGGPYGLEELVQDSGYLAALIIIVLTPLLWSLPTSMMVGELAAAIPSEGGFYIWVRRALGPFWGFQESWLSLGSSVFDMASYPALFVLSLGKLWPPVTHGYTGQIISTIIILFCIGWNLFGARAVGEGSTLLGVVMLAPFVVITVVALLRHSGLSGAAPAAEPVHGDILAGIIVAMWNYMGWDNASTVAEEVENPQKTYPRVMMITLAAIVVSYMIPVIAVWNTGLPAGTWSTGSFSTIGSLVGGPWLGFSVVVGAMISIFGILNSLTMSYSRLPLAMAEDGYLPPVFTRKLSNGAPWASLLLCGLAWICALGLSFDRLLMLDILLYGASLILEFVALVILRVREPALVRPFRVPGGTLGAVLCGIGPTALLVVALIKNHDERIGSMSALTLGLGLMALGVVAYAVSNWMRKRQLAAAA